nr:hypothetical protein [Tanacetum cinerariifolium]
MKMKILLELTSNKLMVASDTLIDFQIKFSLSIGKTVTYWFTLIALFALRRFDNENMLSLMNLILRSILTDLQVTPRRMTKPYSSHRFIANCFNARKFKREVKVPSSAVSQIHNHMLIPNYQDIIFQDFCYSDEFKSYQVIKPRKV